MNGSKILVLCIFLVLIPAVALSATFEVTIDENGFNPPALTINKGDTVRWVNRGTLPHSVTSGINGIADGFLDSGFINPGDSFEHTFRLPIDVTYFDRSKPATSSIFAIVSVQGVMVSPGDSVLFTKSGFNMILLICRNMTGGNLQFSISLNGNKIFSGGFLDLANSPSIEVAWSISGGASALVIPVPADLPAGVHSVSLDVTAPDGRLIAADKAVYTILTVLPPPPPPGLVQ